MPSRLLKPGLLRPWAPQRRSSRSLPAAAWQAAPRGFSLAPAPNTPPRSASEAKGPGPDRLTIVLVGDTGFNPNGAPVAPEGFRKNGKLVGFKELAVRASRATSTATSPSSISRRSSPTATISSPDSKGQKAPYNFKSHPLGLKALIDTGFNLFSLANNHSMDYGANGAEETLYHMAVAAAERAIAYAGIGANIEEATRPGCLELGDTKIAFGATGIITGQRPEHRAGKDKAGPGGLTATRRTSSWW